MERQPGQILAIMTNPEEVEDQFYEQRDALTAEVQSARNYSSLATSMPRSNRSPHLGRNIFIMSASVLEKYWSESGRGDGQDGV